MRIARCRLVVVLWRSCVREAFAPRPRRALVPRSRASVTPRLTRGRRWRRFSSLPTAGPTTTLRLLQHIRRTGTEPRAAAPRPATEAKTSAAPLACAAPPFGNASPASERRASHRSSRGVTPRRLPCGNTRCEGREAPSEGRLGLPFRVPAVPSSACLLVRPTSRPDWHEGRNPAPARTDRRGSRLHDFPRRTPRHHEPGRIPPR